MTSLSSLKAYLTKVWYGTSEKEVWAQTHDQLQHYNINSSKRWKISAHSDRSVAYRTHRMWTLLVNHLKHATHNMSRMWEHYHKETLLNTISRGTRMTFLCKFCQNVWLHWFKLPDGKMIPVDENGDHHLDVCPNAPNARATAISKQEIQKIDDHDRIGGAFGYIESLNERLVNFKLELKVIPLQKRLNLEENN